LTIYFIPVVPVGRAEMFVQCDGCRECWDVSVLEIGREQHQAIEQDLFADQAVRAAILVVLADGVTTENEISALQRVASQLLQRSVDREELGQLCSIAQENRIRAKNYVLTVSRRWNQAQRSLALQAMFLVATAEGDLGGLQMQLLAEMRDLLDMSDNEYQAAIEQAIQWDSV
jgi:uncharacterized tellurite resistance protein B-like protein